MIDYSRHGNVDAHPDQFLTECRIACMICGILCILWYEKAWQDWLRVTYLDEEDISINIPVGCLGSVNDIASACLFLITDECGFMTGQTLDVN